MIHIGIVDDQPALLNRIRSCVNKSLFSLSIEYKIHTFGSSEQILSVLPNMSFSLLILDIELPGMNGLNLAKAVRKQSKDTIILFLSSYDGYMKDAFGINVFKYLLKEDFEEELHHTLVDAIRFIEGRPRKVFRTPNGMIRFYLDEIVIIEYVGRNPYVYTSKGKVVRLSASSLLSVYKALDSNQFELVNSQAIINLNYIYEVAHRFVSMKGIDREFKVSRMKRKELKEHYETFLLDGLSL